MNVPPALLIRRAREADMPAIRTWIRRARLDRTGLDWRSFKVAEWDVEEPSGQRSDAAAGPASLVPGEPGARMAGFCQVRRYGGVRELGSLYVRKPDRGQGIGGALIRACLAEAKPPVHLECVAERQPYYERFGFRRIPRRAAPAALALKSLLGNAVVWLLLRKQVIVMRWDG